MGVARWGQEGNCHYQIFAMPTDRYEGLDRDRKILIIFFKFPKLFTCASPPDTILIIYFNALFLIYFFKYSSKNISLV